MGYTKNNYKSKYLKNILLRNKFFYRYRYRPTLAIFLNQNCLHFRDFFRSASFIKITFYSLITVTVFRAYFYLYSIGGKCYFFHFFTLPSFRENEETELKRNIKRKNNLQMKNNKCERVWH